MTYAKKIALALDQLLNALLDGWPDESLSARAWRWHRSGARSWPRRCINLLICWQKDHCRSAYENEKALKHFPPEYRH